MHDDFNEKLKNMSSTELEAFYEKAEKEIECLDPLTGYRKPSKFEIKMENKREKGMI